MRHDEKASLPLEELDPNWSHTNAWIAKIDNIHKDYTDKRMRVLLSWLMVSIGALTIMIGIFNLVYIKRIFVSLVIADAVTAAIVSYVILFALGPITIILLIWRLTANMKQLVVIRRDLVDSFGIVQQLYELAISREEKRSDNQYEYLINHVHILEIKRLLEKVKRTVGKTTVLRRRTSTDRGST